MCGAVYARRDSARLMRKAIAGVLWRLTAVLMGETKGIGVWGQIMGW